MFLKAGISAIAVASLASVAIASSDGPLNGSSRSAEARHEDNGDRQGSREYCRAAPALPALARETRDAQQQTATPRGVMIVPVAAPPPSSPPPPPPPPMAAPAPGAMDSGSEIIVTGGALSRARPLDSPAAVTSVSEGRGAATGTIMPPRPYPRPSPQPQSGLLTAGEHDDLLNPALYARYVQRSNLAQQVPDLPVLDTDRVLTVEVQDRSGRGIPFANVIINCSDGGTLSLMTHADGRAVFFPALDRLSPTVRISVRINGQMMGAARRVDLGRDAGRQTIGFTSAQTATVVRKLDLMLVVDTTGSMGDEIGYLQSELRGIVTSLQQRHRGLDLRVGFVFYRDTGDEYVTQTVAFDGNVARAHSILAQQTAVGGGDYPEAMEQALIRGIGQSWRPDAVRSLLLVADAPPHDELMGRAWSAAEAARARRIHITPVAASGVADKAEYAMRAMAALTQSRYLFLTDDSGIGNAHAAPAIDCYLVTRLDALLRRVIDSQLSGRRIEPDSDEVIRTVGTYDAGRCILPPDFSKDQ